MTNTERIREVVVGPPDPEYFKRRANAGWELVAVEWQRAAEEAENAPKAPGEDVPYGARVDSVGAQLEENPSEMDALTLILELIVQDRSLSAMAEALNQRGFRTREGTNWTVVHVYKLLPRLIEVSPRIFNKEAWLERRKQIPVAG